MHVLTLGRVLIVRTAIVGGRLGLFSTKTKNCTFHQVPAFTSSWRKFWVAFHLTVPWQLPAECSRYPLLKTIRISPELVSYLKMGFPTKHWQQIFRKKEIFGQMSSFRVIFYLMPNLPGRGSIWFWQCQHFKCFYLLPRDPPALVWLWRERQMQRLQDFTNPAAAQPRQKTQFDFARKTSIAWLKLQNWNRDFFETSKAKLVLNLQSLVQQALKLKDAHVEKPSIKQNKKYQIQIQKPSIIYI